MNHVLDNPLGVSLGQLETQLETPVVPGELASWARRTLAALEDTCQVWQREVESAHRDLFQQIQEEDPVLEPQILHLRQKDEQNRLELKSVQDLAAQLADSAARNEPHERLLKGWVDQLTDRGLRLVISLRKQEVELTTWYAEALNRDRGVAD
jgi:hypothetical protein